MDWTLEAIEVRVLGSLIEKELSTPQYYPMTLNALTAACNQKSNRDPVVAYGEGEVMAALDGLIRKHLAGRVSGESSRVDKYRHALAAALSLSEAELAVLGSLMLRGPQTVGEVRSRTGRMYDFESLDGVEQVLDVLAARSPALVSQLPLMAGQKEARYAHLLAGEPDLESLAPAPAAGDGRLAQLEEEVAALREHLEALQDAFDAFRAQFE
jgi:uncharacterized protein YceH (UPF0502 family)